MLINMAERGQRVERGKPGMKLHDETSLADLGIEKSHSHRWQLLARMNEDQFESELKACIEAGNELTSINQDLKGGGAGQIATNQDIGDPSRVSVRAFG